METNDQERYLNDKIEFIQKQKAERRANKVCFRCALGPAFLCDIEYPDSDYICEECNRVILESPPGFLPEQTRGMPLGRGFMETHGLVAMITVSDYDTNKSRAMPVQASHINILKSQLPELKDKDINLNKYDFYLEYDSNS